MSGLSKPIIVFSGLEDLELAKEAVRRGADDFLVKDQLPAEALGRIVTLAAERGKANTYPSIENLVSLVGETIGDRQLQICEMVERGFISVIYRGRDLKLDCDVALKIPHPDYREMDHLADDSLTIEGRTQRRVDNHPRIVRVFDDVVLETRFGTCHFLVFEWIDGLNARELLNRSETLLPPEKVADIAEQACEALSFSHDQGIIHRDIKPSNLMLSSAWSVGSLPASEYCELLLENPDVKLTDFGLARINRVSCRINGYDTFFRKTKTRVSGTPDYLPPELQAHGAIADELSDIYSMGATFYELLTGCPPFRGENIDHLLTQHRSGSRPRPSMRCRLPSRRSEQLADRIVARAMAVQPADRYQTVAEMQENLSEFRQSLSPGLLARLLRRR